MADILKIGDSGSGICHSHDGAIAVDGTVVEGFAGHGLDGILLSGQNHTVDLSCGHTGKLVASVSDITCDGIAGGRQGDSCTNGTGVTSGTITNTSGGISEG